MDPISTKILIGLAQKLTVKVLETAGIRFRKAVQGTDKQQALDRCLQSGIGLAVEKALSGQQVEKDHVEVLFGKFCRHDDVAREINQMLHGTPLDEETIRELFDACGYDAETLPGFDFAIFVAAFQQAFLSAAEDEAELQDIVKISELKKQTRLQQDILDAVRKQGNDSSSHESRYLHELIREVNVLPWAPIHDTYADPQKGEQVDLADIYIDLDTAEHERIREEAELRQFMEKIHEARRISILKAINTHGRLLVLGDPGSGKSTFMKYVGYVLAQARLQQEEADTWLKKLAPWQHGALLPVWIELRTFAEKVAEAAGDNDWQARHILTALRQKLSENALEACWPGLDEAIRSEACSVLFLLDGLDEVDQHDLPKLVASLDAFIARYSQQRCIITCRPYAYIGQDYAFRNTQETTLAPFSKEQIQAFIARWFALMKQRRRVAKKECELKEDKLRQAVQKPGLDRLAERPLLLTIMAQLHTFKGELPEDRTDLYRGTIELLLRRWEDKSGSDNNILEKLAIPGLKMNALEEALYCVGYNAHLQAQPGQQTVAISEGNLCQWVKRYVANDWSKASEFVDYIRTRAGLLVPYGAESYTFPHRTIQEFLAACYLAIRDDCPQRLRDLVKADRVRWQEVFLLSAGFAARTHRLERALNAVNHLCPRKVEDVKKFTADTFSHAELAARAMLEIGMADVRREEVGLILLERLQHWLAAALQQDGVLEARQRADMGQTLARIGDLRPGVCNLPPDWVQLAGGRFTMGDGKDAREVEISPFEISRYPVTNAQFKFFVDAKGYENEKWWSDAGWQFRQKENPAQAGPRYWDDERFNFANQPVVGVSWYEAEAFCNWLS